MAGTGTIRRQLQSAETLKSVVTTMKTLSAARINQYRRSVAALDSSTRTLELAVQAVLRMHPELLEAAALEPATDAVAAIVLGSDRGLCGPFNERIARHAAGLLTHRAAGKQVSVLTIGRRLRSRLAALQHEATAEVRPPASVGAIENAVAEVLGYVDRWTSEGRADRLYVAYNRPAAGAAYVPTALRVVPVDMRWLARLRTRPWPTNRLPVPLGDTETLVRGLVRQFISHTLVRAFAASLASENAARLASMDAAEKNIGERLEQLQTAYRRARHNAVTAELLDIQAAYGVLGEEGR